jgi:phenylalanine-4-hydroxylase
MAKLDDFVAFSDFHEATGRLPRPTERQNCRQMITCVYWIVGSKGAIKHWTGLYTDSK